MALQGVITINTPSDTAQIVFSNGSTLDSITYSHTGLTYPVASSFNLSQSDFALFYVYKSQFYNSLFQNFPVIRTSFDVKVPVCLTEINSLGSPNIIRYHQTSADSLVYNISYNRNTNIATFAARSNSITITPQEYLQAYQLITLFATQVTLS